jgi:hypothetical protein
VTRRSIHLCGQDVDQPGHICAFFTSRDQEYETLLPYCKEGFDAGEQILNVLDADRLTDHRARLANSGIAVDDPRVAIASSEETYLASGHFEMAKMVDFVRDTLQAAAADGRKVRTAGWMDWMHRDAPGVKRVMEYEARMNELVSAFDCTFMCVYDLSALDGETVVDIMATHPYVILKGQIRQNPFYVPPEIYFRELMSSTTDRDDRSSSVH